MKSVKIGKGQMQVEDQGHGAPLLLIHGFPLDHTMWQAQIERFSTSHRVIAVDLPGMGESSLPHREMTIKQYADELAAILEALEVHEPVTVCGLSMGGYIAWQFGKHHADRVRAFVLCDTKAAHDSEDIAMTRIEMAEAVKQHGAEVIVDHLLIKLFAESTFDEAPQIIEATRDVILRTQSEGIVAALHAMAARSNATYLLSGINVPCLLVCGEQDTITPVGEMRQIAAALADSELIVIPEAGHMAPLENPEVVNDAIASFLASLP